MTAAAQQPDVDLPAGFVQSGPSVMRDAVTVLPALHIATGQGVSIKVCTAAAAPFQQDAFEREAAVLTAFGEHPHIVSLHQRAVTAHGNPALVLERWKSAPPNSPQPSRIRGGLATVIKLCGAVETLHAGDVLHCAVSPEHMGWTDAGEPVLTDFRAVQEPDGRGAVLHRPEAHTAPELLFGDPATPATDVYGLAATLFQLVTGHPPVPVFDGESSATLSLRIVRGAGSPLDGPGIPLELADLLVWAMAPSPAERPPSALWFAEELVGIERRLGLPRTQVTIGTVARRPSPVPH